ncbi:MAG: nitroreductase [Spirochaetia bacterium]|nr:nitroreductase [Spirochaetia bacterium]
MMKVKECIETRKSIRSFKSDPVSKELIFEAIKTAQRAASYKNSQPWEVAVVAGKKKDEISAKLLELLSENKPIAPDIEKASYWPKEIQDRIDENLKERNEFFGLSSNEPDSFIKSKRSNYKFFNAPCVLFFYQDALLNEWSIFDMGSFIQTLMYALWNSGIGSVPQAYLIDYSKEVKKILEIPEGKRLILGLSIGYPDTENKRNQFKTSRANIEEIVRWYE